VAKLCTQCSKPLPRDDARFCNSCGTHVAPAPPGSTLASPRPRLGTPEGQRPSDTGSRPALREQIAFPPQQMRLEPPSWMRKLERGNQDRARELRIKVWEDEKKGNLSLPEEQNHGQISAQAPRTANAVDTVKQEQQVEDLPTASMPAASIPAQENKPAPIKQHERPLNTTRQPNPVDNVDDQPTWPLELNASITPRMQSIPVHKEQSVHSGEMPRPSTPPVQWQRPAQSVQARTMPFSQQHQWEAQQQQWGPGRAIEQQCQLSPSQSYQSPVVQKPETPILPVPQPGLQPVQAVSAVSAAPTASLVPSVAQPLERRGKMRLVFVLVLLVLLGVGGVVTWINVSQPFAVAGITRTSTAFQNNNLGLALQYPQGWTAQVDQPNGAVYFYDANHTDQLNILRVATNGQSIDQYIKKEESQLGMASPKGQAPLSFAGATWQQVQGTTLQSGATYTETLLVTTRGNHFYALVQMAPASTYTGADHLFFTVIRSSLQFL
jgi:hypothetical protein